MKHHINESIRLGVEFLKQAQNPSGSFTGQSDKQPTDTIFFTALIADCLNTLNVAHDVRLRVADYLLRHKGPQWSWNYWERQSSSRPYPDDWDDTACAIATLAVLSSDLLGPAEQATIAKNLISCEVKPGGPYRTWLIEGEDPQWRDIDVVVNANIGHMLTRLGVRSAALTAYTDECLRAGTIKSPYYVGTTPALYFISRWYKGAELLQLNNMIARELARPMLTALERAMLISAACNAGDASSITHEHISRLVKAQRNGSWPAGRLYFEPPENGKQRYAGSKELTTAFAIEALHLWLTKRSMCESRVSARPASLTAKYKEKLIAHDQQEVMDAAGMVARAGNWKIQESTLRSLNRGGRNGWLAYTIYDDFIDAEGDPQQLGVANLAMRRSIRYFRQAVPSDAFKDFIELVFDQMDAANDWELQNARDPLKVPNYGHFAKLAQRSWGQVIGPTGVLLVAGYLLDGPEVELLHVFYRHYSIAKQLSDDAHDWLDDLRRSHITPVVALLLRDLPQASDSERQLHFWKQTITEVNVMVRAQIALAREALDACWFLVKKSELYALLDLLELSCVQAEQGREEAQQFIAAFTAKSLVN